jgi:hypothetical protein
VLKDPQTDFTFYLYLPEHWKVPIALQLHPSVPCDIHCDDVYEAHTCLMTLHTDQWCATCGPWPFPKWSMEPYSSSSSLGATTSIVECFGLLNMQFPIIAILDAARPTLYFQLLTFQFLCLRILFPLFCFTRLCPHPLINPATFLCWDVLARIFSRERGWPHTKPPTWRTRVCIRFALLGRLPSPRLWTPI